MYKVRIGEIVVDCETPEAVRDLLAQLQPNVVAVRSDQATSNPVVHDQSTRDKVMRLLSDMTPITGKILASLLQKREQGLSLTELAKVLGKKDPKAVGGAIAGVGRKAKACGLPPHVVDFDKEQQTYRLTDRFLQIYNAAGRPPVEKTAKGDADFTSSLYQQREI